MAIVTISRGSFSGGKMLAERLAVELGFRCVDRDVIVERAAAYGVSHRELRDALEKPPGFLDRFQHKKYLYLTLIQAALTEEVKTGKVVYHGHAGHLLLKGGGPVFRLRIIAPLEFRIEMARERLHLSREEAIRYIEKMDEDRKRWAQYLYGVDWTDPRLYDLVINLENLTIDDAADAVAHLIRRQACFRFDETCRARMEDLALASKVKAALALEKATGHLEFGVEAERGRVSIRGRVPSPELIETVRGVAGKVPGVKELDLSNVVTPTHA